MDGASGNGDHVGIFFGNIGTGGFLLALIHMQYEIQHAMISPPPQSHDETDINSVVVVKAITFVCEVINWRLCKHTILILVGMLKFAHPCLLDKRENK